MTSREKKIATPEQRSVLNELGKLRDTLGLSDNTFATDYLSYDVSVWNKVRHDNYTGNLDNVIEKYVLNLRNLREVVASRKRLSSGRPFYVTAPQARAINSIAETFGIQGPNRLTIYSAPTGGGKTALIEFCANKYDSIVVEATPAWRTSYSAPCADIAVAAGASGPWRSKRDTERSMLAALNNQSSSRRPRLLIIEEGNYCGCDSINALKLVLNRTSCPLLMVAIPELLKWMMHKSWIEAEQLMRRANSVIRFTKIHPDDIAPFLAGINADDKTLNIIATLWARHANKFGLFDLIWRCLDHLNAIETDTITIPQAEKCVSRALDDMGKTYTA